MVQQIALHRWRWPLAGLLAVLLAGCTTTELVLDNVVIARKTVR